MLENFLVRLMQEFGIPLGAIAIAIIAIVKNRGTTCVFHKKLEETVERIDERTFKLCVRLGVEDKKEKKVL